MLILAKNAENQDPLGFWILRRGFRIPGYWIPLIVSGTWILDSKRYWHSKAQDSGFNNENLPDLGIRIPLHGASKRAKELLK